MKYAELSSAQIHTLICINTSVLNRQTDTNQFHALQSKLLKLRDESEVTLLYRVHSVLEDTTYSKRFHVAAHLLKVSVHRSPRLLSKGNRVDEVIASSTIIEVIVVAHRLTCAI